MYTFEQAMTWLSKEHKANQIVIFEQIQKDADGFIAKQLDLIKKIRDNNWATNYKNIDWRSVIQSAKVAKALSVLEV